MDVPTTTTGQTVNLPVATAAELLTTSSICPACGYPSLGMQLCAYCRPLAQGLAPAPELPA
jgi:hypothetical protein